MQVYRESTIRLHLSEVPMSRLEVNGGDICRFEHRHHFRCFIFLDICLSIHAAIADVPDQDEVVQAFEHAIHSLNLPQILGISRENINDLYTLQPQISKVF
jgi:hypothetical protein